MYYFYKNALRNFFCQIFALSPILSRIEKGCRVLIPEENVVWCPESLMETVLTQVHYLPAEWKDKAHTNEVMISTLVLLVFVLSDIFLHTL